MIKGVAWGLYLWLVSVHRELDLFPKQHGLDATDSLHWIEPLGAVSRAIADGPAAKNAERIIKLRQTLASSGIP